MMKFPIYGKIKFMFQTTNQHELASKFMEHFIKTSQKSRSGGLGGLGGLAPMAMFRFRNSADSADTKPEQQRVAARA